jgi:hypothetical protein
MRGRLDYGPRLYRRFLADFATAVVPRRAAVIAAGHVASYALNDRPGVWSHAVLWHRVARTVPTAMDEHPRAHAWVRSLVGTPVIAEALYRLNTLRAVIQRQQMLVRESDCQTQQPCCARAAGPFLR